MRSPEHVVAVLVGRGQDSSLEDLLRAEGYEIRRALSPADVLSGADPASARSVATLVSVEAPSQVEALVADASSRMPSAKFLVSLPEHGDGQQAPPNGWSEPDGALCISGETGKAANAREIRHFLQGDGYRWGREFGPVETGGVFLLDGVSRAANGNGRSAEKLSAFVSHLSAFADPGEMLQEGLRRMLELLHCEAGSIYLWEERSETLVLKAAEGPEQEKRLGLRQVLGEGLAGWVADVGEPILVTDARKVRKLRGRTCRRYSSFSCLATPMKHGDRLFGVICFAMPRDDKPFQPDDLLLAYALSKKLGSLIRPVTLFSELHSFNDQLVHLCKTCSDLVMEKDTEVEAMRALSADILDSVPVGVIAYDRGLRVRFSNVAAQKILGADPAESATQEAIPLQAGLVVEGESWHNSLLDVVHRGQEFRLQRVEHRRNNQTRTLDIHGSPLYSRGGESVGGILMVRDVTSDVELEAKLFAAERLALMGKIAAKVAHELNNPLDGILRFLSLAARGIQDRPEQARSYLAECRQGLLRMSSILTELLTFSRRHFPTGRPVSVSQVVPNVLSLYEERARMAHIQLATDVPPNLPAAGSVELCGVLGNLVKNALEAMGRDGLLTVRAVQDDGVLRITVADTGPGVPEAIRDKVFEPFFTTKSGGTGLGLAWCRDALERVGGEIRLCPSERGAAFEVVVPVARQRE